MKNYSFKKVRTALFLFIGFCRLSAKYVTILSPNKVFGDYISNVLPELGEELQHALCHLGVIPDHIPFGDFRVGKDHPVRVANLDSV